MNFTFRSPPEPDDEASSQQNAERFTSARRSLLTPASKAYARGPEFGVGGLAFQVVTEHELKADVGALVVGRQGWQRVGGADARYCGAIERVRAG